MPIFSKVSEARLQTCHPDLQVLFRNVIMHYDCMVISGHRGEKEQNEAYAKGYSKLKWPNGKHNTLPSMAADVAPFEKSVDWSAKQCAYFAGWVMGIAKMLLAEGKITHEIRCGIDWNMNQDIDDTTFWDACHFEIVNA
jgi:peptidoglycan L-alanyl-D-glutamate endopeptidase CwlK